MATFCFPFFASSPGKCDDLEEYDKRHGRHDTGNGELQRDGTSGADVPLVSRRLYGYHRRGSCSRFKGTYAETQQWDLLLRGVESPRKPEHFHGHECSM